VKTATEKSSSASAANASTLGDSTDVLAALKAKMEKTEKNNFLIFLNIKARSKGFFFLYFICALSFIPILHLDLRQIQRILLLSARELVVQISIHL
jgi:hypothetical protein